MSIFPGFYKQNLAKFDLAFVKFPALVWQCSSSNQQPIGSKMSIQNNPVQVDSAAARMALVRGKTVSTDKGFAQYCVGYPARPYSVTPLDARVTTWHKTAAEAVAVLLDL